MDQTNTVLADDSLEKADSEPYNLAQVEEFTGEAGGTQCDVLGAVLAYIGDLAWVRNISSPIHYKPFILNTFCQADGLTTRVRPFSLPFTMFSPLLIATYIGV